MAATTAIQVEKLSKQYRIGQQRETYGTLRDLITGTFRNARLRRRHGKSQDAGKIWALKDVSFEVPQGEAVGVIGPNGSGKSTLLKILSRITEPTEGYADVYGRVGSLLEVASGFHPELTGRENIYLNGAILGMSKADIERQFDEIVGFAELPAFLDTPVKHYSSGMYTRLAFAVAAHLQPDILLVDEVLAVGDATFQAKCLGKMGEVAKAGRTVLFVSHNMGAVVDLCKSAILLRHGRIAAMGDAASVVQTYHEALAKSPARVDLRSLAEDLNLDEVRIVEAAVLDRDGAPRTNFVFGEDIRFEFELQSTYRSPELLCAIGITTSTGIPVLHLASHDDPGWQPLYVMGRVKVRCTLPAVRLYPGFYHVSIWVGASPQQHTDFAVGVLQFGVEAGELYRNHRDASWKIALVHADSRWTAESGA